MHILSHVTDNNPSWIIQRKGGEWPLKLFHDQSPRKYGIGPGSNLQPLDLQSDSHLLPDMLPTALRGPVQKHRELLYYHVLQYRESCQMGKTVHQLLIIWVKIQNFPNPELKKLKSLTLQYSKTFVKRPLSKRPKMVSKTNYYLMQVKSIAECSKGSIL